MKYFLFLLLVTTTCLAQPQYPRGVLWEDARYDSLPLKSNYGKIQDLPEAISLTSYFPSVINQSTLFNTDVAWMTSWYAMTALETRNGTGSGDGRDGFSAAFTYRMAIPGIPGCNNPISLINALASMVHDGVPRFSDFGEFCADSIPPFIIQTAQQNRLSGYVKLFNTFDPEAEKIYAVKQALNERNPVVVGMICPPSLMLAKEFWQPHDEPNREQGGHAICITGYNDVKYGGAFQILNSWGRSWGEDGYSWLRYDDFFNFIQYGFELFLTKGTVSGFLQFEDANGATLPVKSKNNSGYYQISKTLNTGDQVRLIFSSEADVFVRFIFDDSQHNATGLYPDPHTFSKLESKVLYLPNQTGTYTLTKPNGIGRFIMITSRSQYQLDELTNKLSAENPSDLLRTNSFLAFDKSNVRFAAMNDNVDAAVVVVDIDQK